MKKFVLLAAVSALALAACDHDREVVTHNETNTVVVNGAGGDTDLPANENVKHDVDINDKR